MSALQASDYKQSLQHVARLAAADNRRILGIVFNRSTSLKLKRVIGDGEWAKLKGRVLNIGSLGNGKEYFEHTI
jgi:hypothetical protein